MHKLLIVDDSKLIRNKIERECDQSLFDIVGLASNGNIALQAMIQHTPAVVTMDLTMPELDGIDCITHMVKRKPDIKILVISALNDKSIGLEALEKGAMGFITKPFSGVQLQSALLEIIAD